jgi:hypothetical protein
MGCGECEAFRAGAECNPRVDGEAVEPFGKLRAGSGAPGLALCLQL